MPLPVSVAAYASSTEYQYSVYKVGSNYSRRENIGAGKQHYMGAETVISYSYPYTNIWFDTTDFPSTYRRELLAEYKAQGLKDYLTVPASQGTLSVVPSKNSGVYYAQLVTHYAQGEWSVRADNITVDNGTFDNSPVSFTFELSG